MAHFYGELNGARGPASRLGTKGSGLKVVAASWQGAVKTTLYHNSRDGKDYALVMLVPWRGKGVSRVLYEGPVDGPVEQEAEHIEQQAERHDNEKRHEEGGDIGFMVSVPDRGVIHVDRDPVSTDKQGDR